MAVLSRSNYNSCYNGDDNNEYDCDYSAWGSYGRWIVLAAIIVGAFFLFLIFACITARRRRRQGIHPYRGTGWAAGNTPSGHAPAQYTGAEPYYGNNNVAAPPYSPSNNQDYYNQGFNTGANQGYFGGQQQGVELQQPENAYARGGEQVYSAPPGPPPGIKEIDGIIR